MKIKCLLQRTDEMHRHYLSFLRHVDGLPALGLRLYLVPVLWMAGMQKYASFDDTVSWFGDPDFGLGLPMPWLMAFLAMATELGGAVLLAVGLATRWVSIPLLITMIVAILTVHGEFGWQAIADASAPFANERVMQAVANLDSIRALVREHGDYDALTGSGSIVILNNGIEFAATYALMLLALMASGGGRYVSLDYFWARWLRK
ncbi:MAG: DoxX family protein [Pseudomonadota bacterium]